MSISGDITPQPAPAMMSCRPGRYPLTRKTVLTDFLPKRVHKNIVDVLTMASKWEDLNHQGTISISELRNIKITALVGEEGKSHNDMPLEMEGKIEELEKICERMTKLVSELADIVLKVDKNINYDNSEPGSMNVSMSESPDLGLSKINVCDLPFFLTWPLRKFGEKCKALLDMYEQELDFKKDLIIRAPHAKTRDIMVNYASAWEHQIFINDKARDILEQFNIELGLEVK